METERLIIDSLRETDREDYFRNISHDRKVLETFICQYAENLEEFDFSRYLANSGLYAIRIKGTEQLIGIMVLCDETATSCEIGYGIGSDWWAMVMQRKRSGGLSGTALRKKASGLFMVLSLREMTHRNM